MLRHPVSESSGREEKLRVAAHLTGSRSPTARGPFWENEDKPFVLIFRAMGFINQQVYM
jgi:hypothetical protein